MCIEETERTEFSISELAREFEVTPRAIRFYEAEGLISPRRDGQRRIYTPRDRTRLKLERFLAVLESHKASLLQQRSDIEAQLSEIQTFEKRVRKQIKRG